jgi:protein tyrosine phosphatase (PTP) superfamily phosphohydrolase (DUF442 family)
LRCLGANFWNPATGRLCSAGCFTRLVDCHCLLRASLKESNLLQASAASVRISAIRLLCAVLASIVLASSLHAARLVLTNNFHTVLEGELYRSARPSAQDVADWHERYGIRTIVNLMGPSGADWYREERVAADTAGIKFVDYKLSPHSDLTDREIGDLLAILSSAEGPILIHCKRGADRTSLVAAMYVTAVAGRSETVAELQLTPLYGYLPIWFLPVFAMYRSWERVELRLGLLNS